MAISKELLIAAPMLQDSLIGKDGLPLESGIVTCYKDNSRTTLKNWYYQSGTPGNYTYITLPNPMVLSAAGTIVDVNGHDVIPFFYPWYTDASGTNIFEPYFIAVQNKNLQLEFTRSYFPYVADQNPGGNSNVYTLQNYIINNCFWRNIGSVNVGDLPLRNNTGVNYIKSGNFGQSYNQSGNFYYVTLAPSQNDGFSMPDFNYIKNSTGGVENISFLKFPSSSNPVLKGDPMPEFYINHDCAAQDPGVSLKCYQFPIALHTENLAGSSASISIQARSNNSGTILSASLYKFTGTGNLSEQSIPFDEFALSTSWDKLTANFKFPDTLGDPDSLASDDAWYLQLHVPIDRSFTLDFTLPSIYLSTEDKIPTNSYLTYDQIDAIISKPRTGDIRTSINNFYPYGWLPMNDGTIGNKDSVATTKKGVDAWPLYDLLWSLFKPYDISGINPISQMISDTGSPVAYGESSIIDWNAKKSLSLTRSMGRVLMGTVPVSALLSQYSAIFTADRIISNVTFVTDQEAWLVNSPTPVAFGEALRFAGTLPTNVSAGVTYYAVPYSGGLSYNIATSLSNAQYGVLVPKGPSAGSNVQSTSSSLVITASNSVNLFTGCPVTFKKSATGTLPAGISENTIYYAAVCSSTIFCVATSFQNAIQGNLLPFVSAGSLENTFYFSSVGMNEGEYAHSQLVNELAYHTHNGSATTTFTAKDKTGDPTIYPVIGGQGDFHFNFSLPGTVSINQSGNSYPANVTQPSTFNNVYIKL
jgi:hypothetical protein